MASTPTPSGHDAEPMPVIGKEGLREGMRWSWPLTPGMIVFGASVGALASQKGLTLIETLAQCAFVYAGGAQLLGLSIWQSHWTLPTLLAVIGVTAAVNSRMFLQSASLRPWLGRLPPKIVYPTLFLMTDVTWSMGIRHRAEGGRDYAVMLGSGLYMWFVWVLAAAGGYAVGQLIDDPKRYAIDLMMVFIFTIMAIPVLKRSPHIKPFAVAALVAIGCSYFLPGFWFIIVGSMAGALAAAFPLGEDA